MKTKIIILALTLSASTCLLTAQNENQRPEGQRPTRRDRGPDDARAPGGTSGQRFVMPLIVALDLNHDGTIDADEAAKSAESLKKLDKNGDGKLTMDELRGPRPADMGTRGRSGREGGRGMAPGGWGGSGMRGQGAEPGGPGGFPGGPGRFAPGGPEGRPGGPVGPDVFRGTGNGGGPVGFHLVPPPVQEHLGLSIDQKKRIEKLETDVQKKIEKILTPEQRLRLKQMPPMQARGGRGMAPGGWGGSGMRGAGPGPAGERGPGAPLPGNPPGSAPQRPVRE